MMTKEEASKAILDAIKLAKEKPNETNKPIVYFDIHGKPIEGSLSEYIKKEAEDYRKFYEQYGVVPYVINEYLY